MGILIERFYGFLCVFIPCLIYQGWLLKKEGRTAHLGYHLFWVNVFKIKSSISAERPIKY